MNLMKKSIAVALFLSSGICSAATKTKVKFDARVQGLVFLDEEIKIKIWKAGDEDKILKATKIYLKPGEVKTVTLLDGEYVFKAYEEGILGKELGSLKTGRLVAGKGYTVTVGMEKATTPRATGEGVLAVHTKKFVFKIK